MKCEFQKRLEGKRKDEETKISADEMNDWRQDPEERYYMGLIRDRIETIWESDCAKIVVLQRIPKILIWLRIKQNLIRIKQKLKRPSYN